MGIVPENIFQAASTNSNILQVIFFTILCRFAMMLTTPFQNQPLMTLFESANMVILKIVDLIMQVVPFGVFALMATLIAEAPSANIFIALTVYGFTIVLSLVILICIVYAGIVRFYSGTDLKHFFKVLCRKSYWHSPPAHPLPLYPLQ